ncbi:MAG: MBL fold metallo-hydrolase [Candidatus Dormibacteria bacterium]
MSSQAILTLRADNPSPMTGAGTNTYIVGEGSAVIVVDPGPLLHDHLAAVVSAARGAGEVQAVVVTHHHPDHLEAGLETATRLGVPLALKPHPESPEPGLELSDGERLPCGSGFVRVMETPGHASDHVCLYLPESASVLCGDMVATEGFIVIDPPDGDMGDYLRSLEKLSQLEPSLLLPGHGAPITAPATHLRGYVAHRLAREATVLAALREIAAEHPATLRELLPLAYADTPRAMWPVAERSLLAHLLKLLAEGDATRVHEAGEDRWVA